MKELSIEQKAKRYDEALPQLKGLLDGVHEEKCDIMEEDIIKIFPELKESEGERIRKLLVEAVTQVLQDQYCSNRGVSKEKVVAWLEKQDEKISDKIVERARTEKQRVLVTESDGVANIDWDTRSLQDAKFLMEYGLNYIKKKLEKQGEQKETLCDKCKKAQPSHSCQDITALGRCAVEHEQKPAIIIPKFRVGDEIKTTNEEPLTITKIDEKGYWSEDLFICSFDDAAKWELVEQKPAWSEEDEINLEKAIWYVENPAPMVVKDSMLVEWLKSLRNRYTWKPSDEQMKVLISEVEGWAKGCPKQKVLESLYNDLKKLMEE